ncbi:MAG: OFA family MFS transporter [Sinobacteraceae bacterium]|nr:OFA family MFS transporter [Nevskiaceae bacterium]
MSVVEELAPAAGSHPGWLSKERTIARERFNRWLVPPAALAIHLCIGMAYGFSVFWLPMTHLIAQPGAQCAAGQDWVTELFTRQCNWSVPMASFTFTLFIAMLGISAAIWGGWVERVGPRRSGFVAALCWGGGLVLGGVGVHLHQLWLVWLGAGILGGIGQGLGYITPVSTLIKWFPDRRGMATGFAIMGYGGGAMIGAPLAVWLMHRFGSLAPQGVAPTLMAMGLIYFLAMSAGAFGFRVAPPGWTPVGWSPPENHGKAMITSRHVHLNRAWKTPQFWLIWGVLCLNVTAGIGVISMASPMLQDIFGPRLLGVDANTALSAAQKAAVAAAAAGLVGLISLFNSLGRIFWASLSDFIGRKNTYHVFFLLGIALYCLLPTWGHLGWAAAFVVSVCLILTMYGGGFSTLPAYLADVFGTQMVGAIHGRLITAWSVAGVIGPVLIANMRQFELDHGVAPKLAYDLTLYILAGLLFVGLICNALVRPVAEHHYMDEETLTAERAKSHESIDCRLAESAARGAFGFGGALAWLAVGVPFLMGLSIAVQKAAAIFG